MSLSVIDVARIVQWLSPNGMPRVTAEHVGLVIEALAEFESGELTYENPNELWEMLETDKNAETLKRIRSVYNDLFCPFSPNENEKVRVLHALLYGDTERALDGAKDFLQAVLGSMNSFGARQEQSGVYA